MSKLHHAPMSGPYATPLKSTNAVSQPICTFASSAGSSYFGCLFTRGVCLRLCLWESAGRIWVMFQTRHNYILNKVLYCNVTVNSTNRAEWGYLKMDCEVTKVIKWNCRNNACFRKGFSNTPLTSNVQIKEVYYTWRKLSVSIPIYLNGELFGCRRNISFEICNLCSWVLSSAAMFFYPITWASHKSSVAKTLWVEISKHFSHSAFQTSSTSNWKQQTAICKYITA